MWDTRYRPLVFSDVLGQEGSVRVLRSRLLKKEAFNTSYIFAGGHGSGKTTLARILARAMLCQQPREDGDPCNACEHCQACLNETMGAFTEMDAASQGTTADMRRLVDYISYDIPGVEKRIYLLDEAHRMSRDAQDVLLKPIEDKRVVVLFCTTEFSKIRDTIKSRCETYEIRKISKEDILGRVQKVLAQEGVQYEDEALLTVIDYARGHVRDVLNKLETIAQLGPITLDAVRERLDLSMVSVHYDILLSLGDPSRAVELVESACDRTGPTQVASGLAEAAMNAYRHAHKIFTDSSQLDRERAVRVYERYGSETVNVARYFLGLGAYASRLDLVCAALAFGGSSAPVSVSSAPVVLAPPVVFAAAPALEAPAPAAPPVAAAAPLPSAPPPPVKPASSPPPKAKATARFVDDNVPLSPDDAASMNGTPAIGVGSAKPSYKASLKPDSRPPVELQAGLNRAEFTLLFHQTLKGVANG